MDCYLGSDAVFGRNAGIPGFELRNFPSKQVVLNRLDKLKAALDIAIKFNLYAYDAYFLECAENLRSPLLTLDLGMQKVAREIGIAILE